MKRMLAAGTFTLAAGAVALLLAASIFYSCRSGGDPHHERSDATLDAPPAEHASSGPDVHRVSASTSLDELPVSLHRR